MQGCVLQLMNPMHPIPCFIKYCKDTFNVEIITLKQGDRGQCERYIVHTCSKPISIRPYIDLPRATLEQPYRVSGMSTGCSGEAMLRIIHDILFLYQLCLELQATIGGTYSFVSEMQSLLYFPFQLSFHSFSFLFSWIDLYTNVINVFLGECRRATDGWFMMNIILICLHLEV